MLGFEQDQQTTKHDKKYPADIYFNTHRLSLSLVKINKRALGSWVAHLSMTVIRVYESMASSKSQR